MKRGKNRLLSPLTVIVVLTALSGLINLLPLIQTNLKGIFFSNDPDVMYVSNALSYIKINQISYYDHPGTPAILLLAASLTPLRFVAKYIIHEPFIAWSIKQFDIIFLYLRSVQNLIFTTAIFIYLTAIYFATRSMLAIFLSWMALFLFSFFPYIGVVISAEAASFLIISLWLLVLSKFISKPSPLILTLLSFLSGLALGDRLNNLFVFLATLTLVFSLPDLNFIQKVRNLILNIFFATTGFIIGTWPIHNNYPAVFNWVIRLAVNSGIHGTGRSAIVDFSSYWRFISGFFYQETYPSVVIVIGLITTLILVSRRKLHLSSPIILILPTMLIGVLVFAKYPLTYYQLSNYFIIVFITTICLCRLDRTVLYVLAVPLLIVFTGKLNKYYPGLQPKIRQAESLKTFIDQHPPRVATVWEWGLAEDHAILWGNAWSGASYDQELVQYKPNLYSIAGGFRDVFLSYSHRTRLFDVCWDQLYIQTEFVEAILNLYPNRNLNVQSVPQTINSLITSNHCLPSSGTNKPRI